MSKLVFACVFAAFVMVFSGCGSREAANQQPVDTALKAYTCPMHPEVVSTNPADKCPRCGMSLVEKKR